MSTATSTMQPTFGPDSQTASDQPGTKPRVKASNLLFAGAIATGLGLIGYQAYRQSVPAPTPSVFGESLTFDQAVARASAEGKYVFAVASASWCGPCQTYKRGALSDQRLASWVKSSAVPVLIDVDQSPDAARALNVRSIPLTVILQGDEQMVRHEGNIDADDLMVMLPR